MKPHKMCSEPCIKAVRWNLTQLSQYGSKFSKLLDVCSILGRIIDL